MRFGNSARYWPLRNRARRLYFFVAGRLFAARYATAEASANTSAVRFLLGNTAIPVILACLLVVAFALLQSPAEDLASSLDLGKLDADAYNSMLESVAAVTGVFLALYFTAVSAVAAAVYATVPHDIRALMLRDRLGNVYVAGVAFTMAVSVLLLLVHAAADTAYRLALPVVAALVLFSIFAFIRLGQRAFSLYDPTRLADTLLSDFGTWLARAKYGGWRWNVPEFQDHYRRRARRSLSSLASLVTIANEQEHLRGESSRYAFRRAAALVTGYLGQVHLLPTRSRWFGERYEHQQWYLVGSTELEMATTTESTLQPKTVPDSNWVEHGVLSVLVEGIKKDVAGRRLEDAFLAMEPMPDLLGHFGGAWVVEEGLRWAGDLSDGVVSTVCSSEFKNEPRSPYLTGLLDLVALMQLSVELGLNRRLADLDIASLGEQIRDADWSESRTPYEFALPTNAMRAMEDIQQGVEFERASRAPHDTRTPGWYVEEVVLNAFEKDLRGGLDALVDGLCAWFPGTADQLLKADKLEPAMAVLSRGLETVWKLERHVDDWEALMDQVRAEGERVDFKRTEWDWDAYREKIRALRLAVLERLAQAIVPLALLERRDDIPDFFGYAVHRTGEACYDALAADDAEFFRKLFPTYFIGTLLVSERLREDVTDFFPEQALTWTFEPILDCLDVSGYAFLYSELHQDRALWEICRAEWVKYLSAEGGQERLQRLAAFSAFQQGQFGMTPRSIMRTRWQMAFGRTLEQLPRDEATASNHPFGHRPVKHPSRVIRGLSPDEGMGSMLIHNASDAFITLFLAKQEGAEELDFGVRDWIGRHLDDEEPRDSQGDVDPESPAEGEGEEQDDEGDGSDDA